MRKTSDLSENKKISSIQDDSPIAEQIEKLDTTLKNLGTPLMISAKRYISTLEPRDNITYNMKLSEKSRQDRETMYQESECESIEIKCESIEIKCEKDEDTSSLNEKCENRANISDMNTTEHTTSMKWKDNLVQQLEQQITTKRDEYQKLKELENKLFEEMQQRINKKDAIDKMRIRIAAMQEILQKTKVNEEIIKDTESEDTQRQEKMNELIEQLQTRYHSKIPSIDNVTILDAKGQPVYRINTVITVEQIHKEHELYKYNLELNFTIKEGKARRKFEIKPKIITTTEEKSKSGDNITQLNPVKNKIDKTSEITRYKQKITIKRDRSGKFTRYQQKKTETTEQTVNDPQNTSTRLWKTQTAQRRRLQLTDELTLARSSAIHKKKTQLDKQQG